uniref:PDZ domain-containing protein n=1 Tax=Tetraodon nigroviridis TaxID=99883 RepID=H3DGM1_TETNG
MANKERPQARLFLARNHAYDRCAGADKDAGETDQLQVEPARVGNLQIKLSAQRGSLGLSIAGGKGSLPYKNHDEGIFISRVIKEGASEKAGIHVGDRLVEVNGLDMEGATHHEAVSALRNAGSCIRMTVLRDRLPPREVPDPDGPRDEWGSTGQQPSNQAAKAALTESTEGCLSKSIDVVVCNGIDTVSHLLENDNLSPSFTLDFSHKVFPLFVSQSEQANKTKEVLSKLTKDSLQDGKHTMGVSNLFSINQTVRCK